MRLLSRLLATAFTLFLTAGSSWAGSIFLTGHDPDFHALVGGNAAGAQQINNSAISFIMDPTFNPFTSSANKFLVVQSLISPPAGHVNGVGGLVASGYTNGVDFEVHDASTLNGELNLLGIKYAGIVVMSDFGGILTQAELDILNARSSDIIGFLNKGGGLYAMAEGNSGAGLTPNGGWFQFLPFVVSSKALNQGESGFTVTPFGASLGLNNGDINGNASHNVFNGTFGLNVVDFDAQGDIMSLAGRGRVDTGGVDTPEPATLTLAGIGAFGLFGYSWKRKKK